MSEATFENRLYGKYLRDYSETLKELYCNMVIAVLADDKDLLKDFVLFALRFNEQANSSILPREGLYYKANDSFINRAEGIVSTRPEKKGFESKLRKIKDDSVIERLLNLRIKDLDDERQKRFFRDVICESPDFAASCKYVSRSDELPTAYRNALKKHAVIGMDVAEKRAHDAGFIRNIYLGHDSNLNLSKLDNQTCRNAIKIFYDAGKCFDRFTDESVNCCREKIIEEYNKYAKLLKIQPLSKERLEKAIENFSLDTFKCLYFFQDYDLKEEVLYAHTIDEVKQIYDTFVGTTIEASKELLEKEAQLNAVNADLSKMKESFAQTEERLGLAMTALEQEREQNKPIKELVGSFTNLVKDQLLSEIMDQIEAEVISRLQGTPSIAAEVISRLQGTPSIAEDKLTAAEECLDLEALSGKEIDEAVIEKETGHETSSVAALGEVTADSDNIDNGATVEIKDISREVDEEATEDSGETLAEEVILDKRALRKVAVSRLFPEMSMYNGGILSEKQLEELAGRTSVLADAGFWMNKDNQVFLAYKFKNYLAKQNRKLVVDWNTRVELFKFERNLDGAVSEKTRGDAKSAHTAMHMMASRGYATYLPVTDVICTSDYAIVKLAKDNPNVMFTVFSNSNELADRIKFEEIENIVPVSYISSREMCIVRRGVQDVVKNMFNCDASLKTKLECIVIKGKAPEPSYITDKTIPEEVEEKAREYEDASIEKCSPPDTIIEEKAICGDKNTDKSLKEEEYIAPKKKDSRKQRRYSLIEETNELLDVDGEIQEGSVVFDETGRAITLGKELGSGGEGKVYECSLDDKVVKIYHKDKITATRKDKLTLMLKNNPQNSKICWPEGLVFNENKQFVGYIMRSAAGYEEFGVTVLKLNSKTVASKSMKGWDRLALVELCLDLCKTFNSMHQKGILMGDVNPRNMMLRKTDQSNHTDYVMVDCDSYQIQGYPCPVGTIVFTSPKIYERNNIDPSSLNFGKFLRTFQDEDYSVASLLFHILMLNQSPFAKKNGADNIEDAIRNYDFAYRLKDEDENTGVDVPDGAFRMIWNNTPAYIKEAFGDVFKRKKNITVEQWIDLLRRYERDILKGPYSRELKPVLYMDFSGNFTKTFKCDLCGKERNMPKDRYDNQEKYRQPHLCNDCMAVRNRAKEDQVELLCRRCGRRFTATRWDEWLVNNKFKGASCETCRKQISFKCDYCGKNSSMLQVNFDDQARHNQPHLCNSCKETKENLKGQHATMVCVRCGKQYETDKWNEWLVSRGFKKSKCNACRAEHKELLNRRNSWR